MKEKHNTTRRFVSYLRVSTDRQGQSGLGLEAQRDSVESYVRSQNGLVVREFVEIESGRKNNRPKFGEALALAGRAQATLVVAKLDRLSRDYDFLRRIINANVDFCAIDYPDANKLTLQIMAVFAEHEAEMISARTKAALKAAKQRGVLLGSARHNHWTGIEEKRLRGAKLGAIASAKVRQDRAAKAYLDVLPTIQELRSRGATLKEIARSLNQSGMPTRTGREWQPTQVWRVLKSCVLEVY